MDISSEITGSNNVLYIITLSMRSTMLFVNRNLRSQAPTLLEIRATLSCLFPSSFDDIARFLPYMRAIA